MTMETRTVITIAVSIIVGAELSLFAWLKFDIGALGEDIAKLSDRLDDVEKDVAHVRG